MLKAIIFDLDGTLLNTLDDLMDSMNYVLSLHNFPQRTYSEIRSFVGHGNRQLVLSSLPDDKKDMVEECFEEFKVHYDKNKENKTAPYNGILEMIKSVKQLGLKSAIVSNKYDRAVKDLNEKVFNSLIDVAIGEREGVKVKPAPDMINIALDELKVNKDECVYIGDSDVDVLTAKNSNLRMLAVSWGFRDKDVLLSCGATDIVSKPSQIIDWCKERI